MRSTKSLCLALFAVPGLTLAGHASGQTDPLSFVTSTLITDNDPATNEIGRDRASINSTAFKNESLWTTGDYQFGTYYREDGKLMVVRRDLTNPVNDWDIVVTEFTSFNINDAHNVPVIGVDGDGYLHLAWGTHNHPLLYTRSTAPVTAGQPMSFIGQATGNNGAINTMTGTNETGTTYPNFLRIPGTDDLLFNYRTGGSGNGTYRLAHWDDRFDTWSWQDQTWIKNTHAGSGLTYNAYPHNLSYDSNGGLHATWTFRYNGSSPTGNSGFQTNHNIFYAYSPDDGATWYKDLAGTVPYGADIDESNAQVIVPIPEGSSLINTGTQAVDRNDRPAIATWWAPRANDPEPDHRRQYMYVGHDGADWFTSQITHRTSDDINAINGINEASLGVNPTRRPQIVIDDYNRAYVLFNQGETDGKLTVAFSQAESRDDWEFLELDQEDIRHTELTVDRQLWETTRQLHIFVQNVDGNSSNGGTPARVVEWDVAAAMGRVLKWTGSASSEFNGTDINFTDLGTPDDFDDFDHVVFDDAGAQTTINFAGNVDAGKVVVDTAQAYTFTGPGALTSGSLAVVGGGSLELATDGNSYTGQTRVSNATLTITGDATAMTGNVVVADGGTLVMDSSDASTMSSAFEVWPTGTLEIGTPGSTTNVFPDNPASILNDGLIRVHANEALQSVTGYGAIEAAAGVTTLQNNGGFHGGFRIKSGAQAVAADADALGTGQRGGVVIEDGGAIRLGATGSYFHTFDLSGDSSGAGALQVAASTDVTLWGNITVNTLSSSVEVGAGALATIKQSVTGNGGLTKQGAGTLRLQGDSTYTGRTVVRGGVLQIDQSTGFGETIVDPGGTFEARGLVRGDLTVLGGGTVRINRSGGGTPGVLFQEDFVGTGGPLNGTTPDISFNGANWVAAPTFEDDGDHVTGSAGGSATLAFTPADGNTYTLETTFDSISGDTDWFALGFTNGQSSANSSNSRFITGNVVGLAWAIYRGSQSGTTNTTFLGDLSVGNPGTQDSATWLTGATEAGGSVAMRFILDTTGGAGNWTVTMEADTGSGYQVIRADEPLNDESINGVGIANSNSADITGTITSFSLMTDSPTQGPLADRTLTVAGDAALDPGALLELVIFDTANHDLLDVSGTLTAGGTLSVDLEQGAPSPQFGDSFDILDFASATGAFSTFDLPTLDPGLFWDTSALLTSGELIVTNIPPGPAADLSGDGDVDDEDLGLFFSAFTGPDLSQGPLTNPAADLSGDGDVDDEDLGLAFADFTGPLAPINIPEPTNLALIGMCGWLVLYRRTTP